MTADDVEADLIKAMKMWWRSPGGGRFPFAKDAPWYLMTREARYGDYDARGVDGEAPSLLPVPLTSDDIEWRDRVMGWLMLLPSDEDRALINAVIRQLAMGKSQPSWVRLVRQFPKRTIGKDGVERMVFHGTHGLRKRYRRALDRLVGLHNLGIAQ